MRSTTRFLPLLLALSAACGGSTTDVNSAEASGPGDGGPDTLAPESGGGGQGGSEVSDAAAEVADFGPYPAAHPSMPDVPSNGGPVLHDPVVVTVTFPNDALEQFETTFDDYIGGSAWWTAVAAEYGIGAMKSGGHVAIPDAPAAQLSDADIQAWLKAKAGDGTLPLESDQVIFALYYPASTTISLVQAGQVTKSCNGFGGYHGAVNVPLEGGTRYAQYAVLPSCGGQGDLTNTASHELIEAATDPRGGSGYYLLDLTAWNLGGGEVGDMCEFVGGTTEGAYTVTRSWSDANAKKGQQPCVPVPPDPQNLPYFNAGIVDEFLLATPGTDVTTEVDCYSFGPLPGEITLSGEVYSQSSPLSWTFDPPTCHNGTKVTMTLHVDASAQSGRDYHYMLLSTLNANAQHLWRGIVSVQ